MEYYTGYREEDLKPVIEQLNKAYRFLVMSKYRNIILKFDTKEYNYCSSTVFVVPNSQLRYDQKRNYEITNNNNNNNNISNNHNQSVNIKNYNDNDDNIDKDNSNSSNDNDDHNNQTNQRIESTNSGGNTKKSKITPQNLMKSEFSEVTENLI